MHPYEKSLITVFIYGRDIPHARVFHPFRSHFQSNVRILNTLQWDKNLKTKSATWKMLRILILYNNNAKKTIKKL